MQLPIRASEGQHLGFRVALEGFGTCEVAEAMVVRNLQGLLFLVEQGGNLLDLVDGHPARRIRARRFQFLAQLLRAGRVAAELVSLEQIDPTPSGTAT